MADQLEDVSKVLKTRRLHLEESLNQFDSELQGDASVTILKELMSQVRSRKTQYEKSYDLFIGLGGVNDREDRSNSENNQRYIGFLKDLESKERRDADRVSQSVVVPADPIQPVRSKLRPLNLSLSKFSGDSTEWPAFWVQFENLVHTNNELSNIEKFSYLKDALQGEAERRLHGFRGVDNEYDEAIKLLEEAYANPRELKRDLARRITDLSAPTMDPQSLTTFQIDFHGAMKQLRGYDKDVDTYDFLLADILTRKLPQKFKDFLFNLYKKSDYSTQELYNGIRDYVKQAKLQHNPIDSSRLVKDKPISYPTPAPRTTIAAFTSTDTNDCMFCQENHYTKHCFRYMTVEDRRRRLQELGKCKRCLQNSHQGACAIHLSNCRYCGKGNHHMYLCFFEFPAGNRDTFKREDITSSNVTSTSQNKPGKSQSSKTSSEGSSSHQHSNRLNLSKPETTSLNHNSFHCLGEEPRFPNYLNPTTALPTARVTAHGLDEVLKTRAFFDQGSQRTVITRSLQRKLNLSPLTTVDLTVCHGFNDIKPAQSYDLVKFDISLGNCTRNIYAMVAEELPKSIKSPGLAETAKLLRKKHVLLADDYDVDEVTGVHILIGTDFYGRFVTNLTHKFGVDLIETPGGYMIYGPVSSGQISGGIINSSQILISRITVHPNPAVHQLDDISDTYTPIQSSRGTPDKVNLIVQCNTVIKNQLKCNLIDRINSQVDPPKISDDTHHIPHHVVLKNSSTTPVRIVYNYAGKDVPNLNDTSVSGPSTVKTSSNILPLFRVNSNVFNANIDEAPFNKLVCVNKVFFKIAIIIVSGFRQETTILRLSKSHITKLIILKARLAVGHGDMSETFSKVQPQIFWPLEHIINVFPDPGDVIRTSINFNDYNSLLMLDKLYPLELQQIDKQNEESEGYPKDYSKLRIDDNPEIVPDDVQEGDIPSTSTHSARVVAQKASDNRRQLIDLDLL